MAGKQAIVAYRCLVAGLPSGSVDFQVRWFDDADAEEIRRHIRGEPLHSYLNVDGEVVSWELVEIFAIEPFAASESGEEVVGFIASTQELSDLA
jgi:hypothetical protein